MELGRFLRLAVKLAGGLGKLHRRGLIHKDIKPVHILVDPVTNKVWFTGFGISSRLARERQAAEPLEMIAGTLAYMAPEQTGRMNRSIDSRSDLYSLGVTFYQMLTGALPFTASDPMDWVHCHVARQPAPPAERRTEVPGVISAVVMKLLAKTAEERYQTAAGLETDLRRALAEWESRGRIDAFPLGTRDLSDQLLIPECLYGREREIASLHTPPSTAWRLRAGRNWFWSWVRLESASPRWCMSCTARWCRHTACSRPASSTNIGVTFPTPAWRRPC
jgi:serine/threonine protein kinase